MAEEEKKHPIVERGKATRFSSEYQPKNPGRKISIKKHIRQLLEADGKLKIPKDQVIQVHKDGSVTIEVPTQVKVAYSLIQQAIDTKNGTAAIKLLLEHIDGLPKQTHAFEGVEILPTRFTVATKDDKPAE